MIKPVKYFLSLSMRNQIVDVGKVTKNASRIIVIFPIDKENSSNYKSNIAKLLRKDFPGRKICAIVSEGNSVTGFDDTIYLVPGFVTFGKTFFKTKKILRNLHIDISFDLNEKVNVITYLVQASLRIGTVDSPFFNIVVKGDPHRMFSITSNTI